MSKTVSLYVYKVKDPAAAEIARKNAMAALGEGGGFLGWTGLRRPDGTDESTFADVIEWDSPEAQARADQQFIEDDRIAPFREQIAEMITGNPYQTV